MFAGMDSHKDTLAISGVDAAGRQQQAQVFPNTREGHRRLVAWLQANLVWSGSASKAPAATGGPWASTWCRPGWWWSR